MRPLRPHLRQGPWPCLFWLSTRDYFERNWRDRCARSPSRPSAKGGYVRRSKLLKLAAAIILTVVLAASANAQGQSPKVMTNQDVLDMVKAGLSTQVIAISIERAPATQFDVQPATLVTLKRAGVSDRVLEAMVKAANPPARADHPASPAQTAEPTSVTPTEADVRSCVSDLGDLGKLYGTVLRMEFGAPMQSQGGTVEMRLGAPNGTKIYPVMVRFREYRKGVAWLYRDPFGTIKCIRNGEVEYHPPVTPEEMAAAIADGETVRMPVKIMSSRSPLTFDVGTLALSKAGLELTTGIQSFNFKVAASQIYNVESQNWQLHLHLVMINPRGGSNGIRQDVYLWDPAVAARAGSVDCSRCGEATTRLETLVRMVKQCCESGDRKPTSDANAPAVGTRSANDGPLNTPSPALLVAMLSTPGIEFHGESSEGGARWPMDVRIVSYDTENGRMTGEVSWPSLKAIHKIEGTVAGGTLTFRETGYIRRGKAGLGCEYKLVPDGPTKLVGTYGKCPGSSATGHSELVRK